MKWYLGIALRWPVCPGVKSRSAAQWPIIWDKQLSQTQWQTHPHIPSSTPRMTMCVSTHTPGTQTVVLSRKQPKRPVSFQLHVSDSKSILSVLFSEISVYFFILRSASMALRRPLVPPSCSGERDDKTWGKKKTGERINTTVETSMLSWTGWTEALWWASTRDWALHKNTA